MARMGRPGLSAEQKRELWARWKDGQSLIVINNDATSHRLKSNAAPCKIPSQYPRVLWDTYRRVLAFVLTVSKSAAAA